MLTAQDLLSSFTGLPHNTDYHLDAQEGPEKKKPRPWIDGLSASEGKVRAFCHYHLTFLSLHFVESKFKADY